MNTSTDDNKDNNSLNDVDDYFKATFLDNGAFSISSVSNNSGYTIALQDNGTNFPVLLASINFLQERMVPISMLKLKYKKDPLAMQAYMHLLSVTMMLQMLWYSNIIH